MTNALPPHSFTIIADILSSSPLHAEQQIIIADLERCRSTCKLMRATRVREGSESVDGKCHHVHAAQIGALTASTLPAEMNELIRPGRYYQYPKEQWL